jgi:hypothetical protein
MAIAVGEAIPLAMVVSTKPTGSVAPEADQGKASNRNIVAMTDRA